MKIKFHMFKIRLSISIIVIALIFLLSCGFGKDTKSIDYQISEINSVPRKTYQIGKINILDFLNQPFAKLKAKYNQKEKIDP